MITENASRNKSYPRPTTKETMLSKIRWMAVRKTVPFFSLILLGQRYVLLPAASFAFLMLFRVILLVVLGVVVLWLVMLLLLLLLLFCKRNCSLQEVGAAILAGS